MKCGKQEMKRTFQCYGNFQPLNVRVWQVASGVPVPAKLPGNTAGCEGLLWVGKRKEAGTEGGRLRWVPHSG